MQQNPYESPRALDELQKPKSAPTTARISLYRIVLLLFLVLAFMIAVGVIDAIYVELIRHSTPVE